MAGAIGTDGYVDLLWASTFVAGTVYLFLGEPNNWALGTLYMTVAMLTKNEGMVTGGLALGLAAILHFSRRQFFATCSLPLFLSTAWLLTSKALGAKRDIPGPGRLSELFHLAPEVTSRIGPTGSALWRGCKWELLVAVLLTAAGLSTRTCNRRIASPARLWLATLCCLGSIALAYVLSPYDLGWHLETSAARTTLAPRLMLFAQSAVWLLILTNHFREQPVVQDDTDGLDDASLHYPIVSRSTTIDR
jgi:hypothetical protein